MSVLYLLKTEIVENHAPEGALALLVPLPPTTPHQVLGKALLPESWTASPVIDESGLQRAVFVEFPEGEHGCPIVFEMADCGDLDRGHVARSGCVPQLADDVFELAQEIGLLECDCKTGRLRKIVDSLASKFQYQSDVTNQSPLTCDILTGNCLSINEAFLKLAEVADIPSAYYIGYFFESEEPLKSKGRHCWVSTLTEQGFESWDIAHHLKRGMKEIRPALNPVPGTRFATCVGRNLAFDLPTGRTAVPHLCEPRWIFADGASRPCEIRISLHGVPSQPGEQVPLHINQHQLADSITAQ